VSVSSRAAYGGLLLILVAQALLHLFVLTISSHSGQLAIPMMMNEGRLLFGSVLEQHAPAASLISAAAQRLLPLDPLVIAKGLHLALISATTVLVFALAQRLAQAPLAGLLAAAAYAWWLPVYGNILFYFDTLLAFLLFSAVWLLLGSPGTARLLLAGLLAGMATLAKQHAWGAVAVLLLWVLWQRRARGLAFAVGVAAGPLALVAVVAAQGNLANYLYWNWAFNFSGLMDSLLPTGDFVRKVALSNLFVPAFGLLALHPARRQQWLPVLLVGLAAMATMLPRFGIIHVTAHLPFSALAAGVVLHHLLAGVQPLRWQRISQLSAPSAGLAGVLLAAGAAWAWTGAAPYFPTDYPRGTTPAYDEFAPVAQALAGQAQPDDTLFVLPETDSTPNLHAITRLLPPGTWVKGWHWYFEAPGIRDQLLAEWQAAPPDFIVVFPDLLEVGQPGIAPLVAFAEARYTLAERIPAIIGHGDALIYRLNSLTEGG
jgi:hypothetical protein